MLYFRKYSCNSLTLLWAFFAFFLVFGLHFFSKIGIIAGMMYHIPPANSRPLRSFILLAGILLALMTACPNPASHYGETRVPEVPDKEGPASTEGADAAAPHISSLTRDTVYALGRTPTLIVRATASDGGTLSYQWYRSTTAGSNTRGTLLYGEKRLMFQPPAGDFTPPLPAVRYYYVVVTNTISGKTAVTTSPAIRIEITADTPAEYPVLVPPQGAFYDDPPTYTYTYTYNGNNITATALEVTVTTPVTDGGTLSYQWYRNTVDEDTDYSATRVFITGATLNTYTPPINAAGTMYYYCEVKNTIPPNPPNGNPTEMFSISVSGLFKVVVDPRPVTITGLSASNKTYDSTTEATPTGTAAISNIVAGDALTVVAGSAAFADKNVGTGKTVTFSGYSLGGAAAVVNNYTLSAQPTSVTADITARDVTLTVTAKNKVYDKLATAEEDEVTINGKIATDALTASGDATFMDATATVADANVGTGKPVSFTSWSLSGADAGNYNLTAQPLDTTADITPKPIRLDAGTREYDGTADATIATTPDGTDTIATIFGADLTFIGTDDVKVVYVGSNLTPSDGAFDDDLDGDGAPISGTAQNVGTGKTVTYEITEWELQGTDAGNYTLAPPTAIGNITPKTTGISVSISTAPSRRMIPFNSTDTTYGNTTTFEVTVTGIGSDTVDVEILPAHQAAYGLLLEDNTGITNATARTVTLNYNGGAVLTTTNTVTLRLTGNYSGSTTFSLTVYDGQASTRAIPVTEDNLTDFNTYANTTDGLTRYYKLSEAITLPSVVPPASNWTPIGADGAPFTGGFDGDNKTISDLTINSTANYQGMFGYIGAGGSVHDVTLADSIITGTGNAANLGPVAGYNAGTVTNCTVTDGTVSGYGTSGGVVGNNSGTVTGCSATGGTVESSFGAGGVVGNNSGTVTGCSAAVDVSSNNATSTSGYGFGGVVGYSSSGSTIEDCHATGDVTGTGYYVGGVVGYYNSANTIRNCYATGDVTGTANTAGISYVGGVVGYNENTSSLIQYCYATGDVTGTGDYVGGVAGRTQNVIQSCYATGNVTGNDDVGGVVGYTSSVINCYATGDVTGNNYVGGVAGQGWNGVQRCYATGSVTGAANVGGVVGWIRQMVRNSVALNSSVTTTATDDTTIGRVVGGFYDADVAAANRFNYASEDMDIYYNTSTAKSPLDNADATGKDGADIASTDWEDEDWWTTTSNWDTGSFWDFTTIWEIVSPGDLPTLRPAP
jgi:hypothetical protein